MRHGLPTQNLLASEICMTLLHLVAIGTTFLRLLHRWQTKRMWWDDYTAIIPLVVDFPYVILVWLRFKDGVPVLNSPTPLIYSSSFAALMCWTIVWGSRFSLSLSIARIFPEKHICRRLAFGLSFAVSSSYVANFLVSTLACRTDDEPTHDLNFNCFKTHPVHFVGLLCAMVLDFTVEILMIATPLVMLRNIKLPTKERRLILALFSSNFISLLSLIGWCIWFFVDNGPDSSLILRTMFGLFQAAINLLICNLLIVTMLVYRILRRRREENVQVPGPTSPLVTRRLTSSNNLAIRSDNHNNSTFSWKSSDRSLTGTTHITLTSVFYDTFSRISSGPTASDYLRTLEFTGSEPL